MTLLNEKICCGESETWNVNDSLEGYVFICDEEEIIGVPKKDDIFRTYLKQIKEKTEKTSKEIDVYEVLLTQVEGLKKRINLLENQSDGDSQSVIEICEMPLGEIKDKMVKLLSNGETIYVDEIANILQVDIKDALIAFQELKKEGKLFIDGSQL